MLLYSVVRKAGNRATVEEEKKRCKLIAILTNKKVLGQSKLQNQLFFNKNRSGHLNGNVGRFSWLANINTWKVSGKA